MLARGKGLGVNEKILCIGEPLLNLLEGVDFFLEWWVFYGLWWGEGEQFWPAPRGNPCSIFLGCGLSFMERWSFMGEVNSSG